MSKSGRPGQGTAESYIQDSRILDKYWKPVSFELCKDGNWWEHEIIRGFVAAYPIGHWILVYWNWTGDKSAPVKKAGRPKNWLMQCKVVFGGKHTSSGMLLSKYPLHA